MNQLIDVKKKARTLVEDPDGDWADDEYILPYIVIAWESAINYLTNTCSPFITEARPVLNVPMGTTDFTPFQVKPATPAQAVGQAGAPLVGLMTPLKIWWKVAGQPENNYCEADEKKDLPFITPANYIAGQRVYWEWRANKILVTPLNFNADFLVKGEYLPQCPLKDEDYLQLDPLMSNGLGYATAALIGGGRVNQSYLTTWQQAAENEWDNVSARLVRKELSTTQRAGRMSGRAGRRGYR
jgi:hypothetical protein